MKRIIIVGMGSIGIRHARICGQFNDLAVELCDPRSEGLREARQTLGDLPVWDSWEKALASRPEMMVIATPHHLHASMVCQAVERGIHVLCEKPMSDSVDSALKMTRLARQAGVVLRIGFMHRFQPGIRHLRAMLQGGELGNLMSIHYHIGSLITLENSRSRYQADVHGALVMDYVHGLDLLLWLTGSHPYEVYAREAKAGVLAHAADPTLFEAMLSFPGPVLASMHMDYATKPQLHELTLLGDRAMARLDLGEGRLEIRDSAKNERRQVDFNFHFDEVYTQQLAEFFAEVRGGSGTGCRPEEGAISTLLMQRLLESATQKRPFDLADCAIIQACLDEKPYRRCAGANASAKLNSAFQG